MRSAAYTPEVLDHVGWNAPTAEPVLTLNGRALHRWPSLYVTDEVRSLMPLSRLHRSRLPLLDGAVMGWPAWLVDALAMVDQETDARDRHREVSRG